MTIAAKSAAYSIAATIATVGIIAVLTLGLYALAEFAFVVAVKGGLI